MALAGCAGHGDSQSAPADDTLTLLVGSYCEPGDSALRVYRFNTADTSAVLLYKAAVDNASDFTQAPSGIVYAVTERGDSDSYLTALRTDTATGRLNVLNSRPTGSGGPCYVQTSPDGRFAVTANYGGGSVSVFPIETDGSLSPRRQLLVFEGNGPVERRQASPHPHCILFTPDNRYMLVSDLGTDLIHQFDVSAGCDSLISTRQPHHIQLIPGSGPRHMIFNHVGSSVYIINEISDSVAMLHYEDGRLTTLEYVAADTAQAHGAGDIHLGHDGSHLYASLRLRHDGIATFDVDALTGRIILTGHTPTGKHPRNFTLSPDGRLMLVACRDENAIEIYDVDPTTGQLTATGRRIPVPRPVCVKFLNQD